MKFVLPLALLLVTTAFGQDIEWAIASEGVLDTPKDLTVDQLNDVYLTGAYEAGAYRLDTVSIPWIPSGSDIFLSKLNSEGAALWTIYADGFLNDAGLALAPAMDEGVFWAGRFQSPTLTFQEVTYSRIGTSNSLVAKITPDGTADWVDHLHSATGNCLITDVLQTDLGVVVSGDFSGLNLDIDGDLYDSEALNDPFLLEYDMEGNYEWFRAFPGDDNETFSSVASLDGDFIVGGQFYGDTFSVDDLVLEGENATAMLMRIDKTDGAIWGNAIRSDGNVFLNTITTNNDDLCFVGGYFTGDSCFIENDKLVGSGFNTGWYACFNSDGGLVWSEVLNGSSTSSVTQMQFFADSLLITGDYRESIYVGGEEFISEGQTDVYLISTNISGIPAWQRSFGGNSFETSKALCTDAYNHFYYTAEFVSNPLVIESESFSLGHPAGTEILLLKAKRNNEDLGLKPLDKLVVDCYPNPTEGNLYFSKPIEKFQILSLSGQVLMQDNNLNMDHLSIQELPAGIYLINLEGQWSKLIKSN